MEPARQRKAVTALEALQHQRFQWWTPSHLFVAHLDKDERQLHRVAPHPTVGGQLALQLLLRDVPVAGHQITEHALLRAQLLHTGKELALRITSNSHAHQYTVIAVPRQRAGLA